MKTKQNRRTRDRAAGEGGKVLVPVTTLEAILSVMNSSVRGFRAYGEYLLAMIAELERTQALPAEFIASFRRDVEATQRVFVDVEMAGAPLLESIKALTAANGTTGAAERVM